MSNPIKSPRTHTHCKGKLIIILVASEEFPQVIFVDADSNLFPTEVYCLQNPTSRSIQIGSSKETTRGGPG